MAYFRTCSVCGANLDPGERCECELKKKIGAAAVKAANYRQQTVNLLSTRQTEGWGQKKKEAV